MVIAAMSGEYQFSGIRTSPQKQQQDHIKIIFPKDLIAMVIGVSFGSA